MDLTSLFGFGLLTGATLAFGYVVVGNWRAVLAAARQRQGERRSLVFLAGPVLLLALVQGLRMALPVSGATIAMVISAGLLVDPAAVPVVAVVAFRRLRNDGRP